MESRYGSEARGVVQNLLLLGHTKIGDLADAYGGSGAAQSQVRRPANGNDERTNGQTEHDVDKLSSAGQLYLILCRLLQSGLVEPVTESMFRSPADAYSRAEQEIVQTYFSGGTKGLKQKEDLKSKIKDRLRASRDEGKNWMENSKGVKRALNGAISAPEKRRKLVNGDAHTEEDGVTLDVGVILLYRRQVPHANTVLAQSDRQNKLHEVHRGYSKSAARRTCHSSSWRHKFPDLW